MNDTLKTLALCLIAISLVIQTIIQITSGSADIVDLNAASSSINTGNSSSASGLPAGAQNVPAVEDNSPKATLVFDEYDFDFGNLKEGDVVTHIFKFKNTSLIPLIIKNATGTCGCTVPKWPKEPIAAGESGDIEVKYDSKGKSGLQKKSVIITANTDPLTTTLNISSTVIREDGQPPVQQKSN